jgi:hypothetical protein
MNQKKEKETEGTKSMSRTALSQPHDSLAVVWMPDPAVAERLWQGKQVRHDMFGNLCAPHGALGLCGKTKKSKTNPISNQPERRKPFSEKD